MYTYCNDDDDLVKLLYYHPHKRRMTDWMFRFKCFERQACEDV